MLKPKPARGEPQNQSRKKVRLCGRDRMAVDSEVEGLRYGVRVYSGSECSACRPPEKARTTAKPSSQRGRNSKNQRPTPSSNFTHAHTIPHTTHQHPPIPHTSTFYTTHVQWAGPSREFSTPPANAGHHLQPSRSAPAAKNPARCSNDERRGQREMRGCLLSLGMGKR